MVTDSLLPMALFAWTSTLSPGGATTLATTSGVQFGFRRSIPLVAGISSGLAALASLAGAGLSGLLLAAPTLQLAMKVLGTSYLLWLALKIVRSGPPALRPDLARPFGFASGAGLLWMNPKAWAMVTGAAASFAPVAANPLELAALLGCTFGVSAGISLSIWCCTGLVFSRLLRTSTQWHMVNAALGALLAASVIPTWLS